MENIFKEEEVNNFEEKQEIINYVLKNVPVDFNPGKTMDVDQQQNKVFLSCGYKDGMRHGPFKFISSDHVTVTGTFNRDALNGWLEYNDGKTSKSFFVWNNHCLNNKKRFSLDLLEAGEKVPVGNKIMLGVMAVAFVLGAWHGNAHETNARSDGKGVPAQYLMQNQNSR